VLSNRLAGASSGPAEFHVPFVGGRWLPPAGKRPGEGDTVFTRADGVQVRRYYNSSPLAGCEGRVREAALYAAAGVGPGGDLPSAADLVKRL